MRFSAVESWIVLTMIISAAALAAFGIGVFTGVIH
jgi:hypothetical protein